MTLDALLYHILTRGREQSWPAPLIRRVLQEWPHSFHANLAFRTICIHSLLLLIRAHSARMYRIDPRPTVLGTLEAWLVVRHTAHDGTREENLGKLGACVERVGADIGIYLVDRGEMCGGEGGAVEVGRLEDEAGVGRCLEVWEQSECQEHLGEVVDLEVGV